MSQPKPALEVLKKGTFFRMISGKQVRPEVWTWNGQLVGSTGFRVTRVGDGFNMTINSNTFIVPIDERDLCI